MFYEILDFHQYAERLYGRDAAIVLFYEQAPLPDEDDDYDDSDYDYDDCASGNCADGTEGLRYYLYIDGRLWDKSGHSLPFLEEAIIERENPFLKLYGGGVKNPRHDPDFVFSYRLNDAAGDRVIRFKRVYRQVPGLPVYFHHCGKKYLIIN